MKIVSRILIWLPALAMVGSAFAKLTGAQQVVDGLTKVGFLLHFPLLGLALLELTCVALLLIPATFRFGLLMVTGYLGGALAIEIASGGPTIAGVLLALIWIGAFLKDRSLFGLPTTAS